jgi:hypothetical protein
MTRQESEDCILPEAPGNRSATQATRRDGGGKAVPVKEEGRQQKLNHYRLKPVGSFSTQSPVPLLQTCCPSPILPPICRSRSSAASVFRLLLSAAGRDVIHGWPPPLELSSLRSSTLGAEGQRGRGAKGKDPVGTLYPSGPWPLRTIAKSSATTHAWSNSCAISETSSLVLYRAAFGRMEWGSQRVQFSSLSSSMRRKCRSLLVTSR